MTSALALQKTLSQTLEKRLLLTMLISREADKRESVLYRQGRGQFHLPSAGHEAMAGLASVIAREDWLYCYYRDRALLLELGTPLYDMALGFFAKKDSSSGGRQMASHFCDADRQVVSCATPTGIQCLPGVGTAWGLKRSGKNAVSFICIGDAATRQGEFYEAYAFAVQEKLPAVFVVEDNQYGVSTCTKNMTPINLDLLPDTYTVRVNGRDPLEIKKAGEYARTKAVNGSGPTILWLEMDRLMAHTSSDQQELYRSTDELALIARRDPLLVWAEKLKAAGELDDTEWETLIQTIPAEVKATYARAEAAPDPSAKDVHTHIFGTTVLPMPASYVPVAHAQTMAEAINGTLRHLLVNDERILLFGEDIEDPKGGVFGLTKGLSQQFGNRVQNSPLAEATIVGLTSGLALAGYLPIFELQFIDFVGPAFNQLVNQIATLRWRTMGRQKCPLIIYAPCGSYISGGGPWHSQTNEGWFAHAPGLKVYMPATAQDAAEMFYAAAHSDDPTLLLLPKNQFRRRVEISSQTPLYPEKASIIRVGNDLTLIAWGNMVSLACEAAEKLEAQGVDCEVINLRSIVPCDWHTLRNSVQKTGRVMVMQEDNRTCSMGQAILAELVSDEATWSCLKSSPRLLTREDIHIGFHRNLEWGVLPHADDIIHNALTLCGGRHVAL